MHTSRKEIGYFVPPASQHSPTGFISINDVLVDEREIVYAVDRERGGSVHSRNGFLTAPTQNSVPTPSVPIKENIPRERLSHYETG